MRRLPTMASAGDHEAVKHSVKRGTFGANATPTESSADASGPTITSSKKHLPRYVDQLAGRHHILRLDTDEQAALLVQNSAGKPLPMSRAE